MAYNEKQYVENYHKLACEMGQLECTIQELEFKMSKLKKDTKWAQRHVSDCRTKKKAAAFLMLVSSAFIVGSFCMYLSNIPALIAFLSLHGSFFTGELIWWTKAHFDKIKAQEKILDHKRVFESYENEKAVSEDLLLQYEKELEYILYQLQKETHQENEVQQVVTSTKEDKIEMLNHEKENLLNAVANEENELSKVMKK